MLYQNSRFQKIVTFIKEHPLAARHQWRSVFRFLLWQLTQRVYPHDTVWEFTSSTKLVLRKGLIGATGNLYTGLHDFAEMGFLLHFLRKEDVFADIGANTGTYSVLATGHAGAFSLIFEPIPETMELIQKNIKVNSIGDRVKLFPFALGDEKKTVRFSNTLDAENHVLPEWEHTSEMIVSVERFDDLCYPENIPSLIKIDVEGYEMAVLKGMRRTLANQQLKAVIIELNNTGNRYNFDEKQIHKDFLEAGFQPYTYECFTRKLIWLETFGPNNTIYIRDLSFVLDRLKTAPLVKVGGELF